MSKIKLLTIAVVGLLLINISVVAFLFFRKAPLPPMPTPGRPGIEQTGPKNIIVEKLHFDKGQVALYEVLIEQHQGKIRPLNDSISLAKKELYATLNSENFAGKDALIARLGLLQRQVELTHYEHFTGIKAICKPEQKEYFDELTKELAMFFTQGKREGGPPRPARK